MPAVLTQSVAYLSRILAFLIVLCLWGITKNLLVAVPTAVPQLVSPYAAPLPFVQVLHKDCHLLALIDSGAQVNVVGKELASYLKCCLVSSQPLQLNGCGGVSQTSQWVRIPLQFSNGFKHEVIAAVAEEFGTALILGAPFLTAVRARLDYGMQLLRMAQGAVPLLYGGSLRRSNILVNTVEVPPLGDEDKAALAKLLEAAALNDSEKKRVEELLLEFGDLWIGNPRGATDILRHSITVTSKRPVRQKPRRFAPVQQKIIDEEVEKMLKAGVIRLSRSPHAQEVVLVLKKTRDWRFCIDYRWLNLITVADGHPLPRIQDLIRNLRDATHLVALDLRSGY